MAHLLEEEEEEREKREREKTGVCVCVWGGGVRDKAKEIKRKRMGRRERKIQVLRWHYIVSAQSNLEAVEYAGE